MPRELILKKLEQIKELLGELEQLVARPWGDFKNDFMLVRAAERNFQLIVDLASDINTHLLLEAGSEIPDTYRQSFSNLEKAGVLPPELTEKLVVSAKLRNILVHEYDFEEDVGKFYAAAKAAIPTYREYIKTIHRYAAEEMNAHSPPSPKGRNHHR